MGHTVTLLRIRSRETRRTDVASSQVGLVRTQRTEIDEMAPAPADALAQATGPGKPLRFAPGRIRSSILVCSHRHVHRHACALESALRHCETRAHPSTSPAWRRVGEARTSAAQRRRYVPRCRRRGRKMRSIVTEAPGDIVTAVGWQGVEGGDPYA